MGFSQGHNRSLSDKMRDLHAAKMKGDGLLAGKKQPIVLPSPMVNRNAKHLDLLEATSRRDQGAVQRSRSPNIDDKVHRDIGCGKENLMMDTKRMEEPPPPYSADQSYRQAAGDKYITQAAVALPPLEKPKPAAVERLRPQDASVARPDSDMSAMTTDSMEVNFHISSQDVPAPSARDRRPKIQVTIPGKRTHSSNHLAHQINRQKTTGRMKETTTTVSPASTTRPKDYSEAPARMSVVSPLSVVEMPKPRRPFSAFSLEDMTSDMARSAPLVEKSTSSDSSDDAGDRDDRSSNYSRRSSMSSLTEEAHEAKPSHDRRHSIAFSIMSPAAAGVFDSMPAVPKIPEQHMRAMKSNPSLAPNTNKPLPPEPSLEEVAPLKLPGQSYSRHSMQGKRKAPTPLSISRSATVDSPSRHPSRMSSLRSKYTPADLDALDAAFAKTSPQPLYDYTQEPSLEQAQLELEAHLHTIEEDDSSSPVVVPMDQDPLQISRGPNQMVPSRQAPYPPSSMSIKLSDGSTSSRKRFQKKTSTHVALQMKAQPGKDGREIRRRISAPVGGSIKANKILGKACNATPMEREASSESNWSSSESPDHSYADSSSPNMSTREDSNTPETDVSSVADPAFEEVRARLELLSPKNDSQPFFPSLSHLDSSESTSSVKLPIQEQSNGHTPETRSRPTTSEADQPKIARNDHAVPTIELSPVEELQRSQVEIAIKIDGQAMEGDSLSLGRRGGQDGLRPRSLASIAMSEIPDMYADLPSPGPTTRESLSAEEAERMISADAAEIVLLRILQNLDNLQDLFATATVSRGFYRTFKRHELPLMKSALHTMSPAAWELREMSAPCAGLQGEASALPKPDYSPTLYLQHYMRDMYTMIALKSMILIHCESFLRADTITALAGGETERASQIDDAFWRVWTFCQVFGCGSNREDDIVGQMDWLRGGVLAKQQNRGALDKRIDITRNSVMFSPPTSFGQGNAGGLTAEDLYDMTEIWTCLGVLVRGFQGKRQEARDYGVFQNAQVTAGEVEAEDAVLEEWTYHLLTLAPSTVLDITSPTSPNAATFAHARSRGYTTWTPPTVSRATFLKEAVSRVYQEKISLQHPSSAPSSPVAPNTTFTATTPPQPQETFNSEALAARWRCARHAAEIRAKRNDPAFAALPPSEDRPMSNFPSVFEALDTSTAPAVPSIPSAHQQQYPSSESTPPTQMIGAIIVPAGPQVRDPVDVAVDRLVAMGFDSRKAAKALADTDTGNSVDFDGALQTLVRDRKRDVNSLMHSGYRGRIGSGEVPALGGPGVGLGLSGTGITRYA